MWALALFGREAAMPARALSQRSNVGDIAVMAKATYIYCRHGLDLEINRICCLCCVAETVAKALQQQTGPRRKRDLCICGWALEP